MNKIIKTITVNSEKFVSEADYQKLSKSKVRVVKGSQADIPFVIGGKYLFRTVTYFATGEVAEVTGKFLVLKNAAWIADTGRFREAIMQGTLSEVEPVEVPMYLNTDTITDAFEWVHDLPNTQK